MRFSEALEGLQKSMKMTRASWYSPALEARGSEPEYVVYQRGYPHGVPINKNTAEVTGLPEGTVCYFSPYLMRHFGDHIFAPWVPTQDDLIATDWQWYDRPSRSN